MIQKVIENICNKLSKRLEKNIIYRQDGLPYLERYYILHSNTFKWIPGIYLHKFVSGDEDLELHNHPWGSSVSFILTGGYTEERRHNTKCGYVVRTSKLKPGNVNIIYSDTFHRVDLIGDYAWTLFLSGDRKQDWGFWDRETEDYTPWQEHVSKKSL